MCRTHAPCHLHSTAFHQYDCTSHTSSGFQITQAITPVTLERLDCLLVVYKVNLSWVSLIDKLFLYPELIIHNVPKHLGLQKLYFCCLPQNIICFLQLLFLHLCYSHSKASTEFIILINTKQLSTSNSNQINRPKRLPAPC